MQYKVRYRPLEKLGRDGWQRLSDGEQDALIRAAAGRGGAREQACGDKSQFVERDPQDSWNRSGGF
jgi:arginine-tRNA-protein transferase